MKKKTLETKYKNWKIFISSRNYNSEKFFDPFHENTVGVKEDNYLNLEHYYDCYGCLYKLISDNKGRLNFIKNQKN